MSECSNSTAIASYCLVAPLYVCPADLRILSCPSELTQDPFKQRGSHASPSKLKTDPWAVDDPFKPRDGDWSGSPQHFTSPPQVAAGAPRCESHPGIARSIRRSDANRSSIEGGLFA